MGSEHSKAGIPEFIRARDRYAEANGLSAASVIGCDDDNELAISTTWRGPESAFRQIGLLRPRQFAPKRTREGVRIIKAWASGRLNCRADGSLEFIETTDVPTAIERLADGIERCTFPSDWQHDGRISFHGTEEALRAAGIIAFPATPWIRGARSGSSWKVELQPDGLFLHWQLRERRKPRASYDGTAPSTWQAFEQQCGFRIPR